LQLTAQLLNSCFHQGLVGGKASGVEHGLQCTTQAGPVAAPGGCATAQFKVKGCDFKEGKAGQRVLDWSVLQSSWKEAEALRHIS
jgi:hypothetical protein